MFKSLKKLFKRSRSTSKILDRLSAPLRELEAHANEQGAEIVKNNRAICALTADNAARDVERDRALNVAGNLKKLLCLQ